MRMFIIAPVGSAKECIFTFFVAIPALFRSVLTGICWDIPGIPLLILGSPKSINLGKPKLYPMTSEPLEEYLESILDIEEKLRTLPGSYPE
jgi:hypothetical protein